MNKLPNEILHNVFIQLELPERITCTLVCRHFYNVLSHRSLLYDVHISRFSQFTKFKDMIDHIPSRGAQVEKLTLISCLGYRFDQRMLLNMFPNVREIKLLNTPSNFDEEDPYDNDQFDFLYPTSKLEYLSEEDECQLTCRLAASNRLGRLKVLDLQFQQHIAVSNDIILRLVNMPVLQELFLDKIQLTIMNLETIHDSLPSVKTFCLVEVYINAGEMPLNIRPATAITKIALWLENASDLQVHIQLYQYLSKKYPNLTILDSYDAELFYFDEAGSEELNELFEKGVLPFLRVMGSQLSYFKFENFPTRINVFKTLDDWGVKLNNLSISLNRTTFTAFANLARSKQSGYISRLDVDGWFPDAGDLLTNMTSLETLKIKNEHVDKKDLPDVNICQILETCQATLSCLSVKNSHIIVEQPVPAFSTSITSLKLARVKLTDTLASITSTCFPGIEILFIEGDISNNITISLPNNYLKEVQIIIIHDSQSRPNGFLIRTTIDDKSQYHSATGSTGSGNIKKASRVSSDEYNDSLTLTLVCATVRKLYLYVWALN